MRNFPVLILGVVCLCSCTRTERKCNLPPKDDIMALCEMSPEQLRVFLKGDSGEWMGVTDQHKGKPPPPAQKPYPEDIELIELVGPADIKLGNIPLLKAVNERRSRRAYTGGKLTIEELSFLLWSTQGVQKVTRDKDGNIVNHFRTVPSGGARHPFETYLLVNKVEGLKPGVCRYLALEHKLLPVSVSDSMPDWINYACYGQDFTKEAAVVFVWTAMPCRTEWRYAHTAPKMIAIEAGHVCQNLYLAVESIGAGACAMLGYDQKAMDELIGVDGKDEFTVYIATVGKR